MLSLAGGQTRIASGTVQLIRWIDGKAKSFDVPVGQILSSGELDRDPWSNPAT